MQNKYAILKNILACKTNMQAQGGKQNKYVIPNTRRHAKQICK